MSASERIKEGRGNLNVLRRRRRRRHRRRRRGSKEKKIYKEEK